MSKPILELLSLLIIALFPPDLERATGQTTDPLRFPKDDYTIETMTVTTSAGERKVTYRSYMHLPYVANPIDRDYQSLNVRVPIEIDGVVVDAIHAPILFNIGVGGYMSVKNAIGSVDGGKGGPPPGRSSGRDRTEDQNRMPPMSPSGPVSGMSRTPRGGPDGDSKPGNKPDLALAAGFVVVSPGCRGRDNQAADGSYYGKAPAAIVDLKAAVRYLRHNKDVMPGNTDWIGTITGYVKPSKTE